MRGSAIAGGGVSARRGAAVPGLPGAVAVAHFAGARLGVALPAVPLSVVVLLAGGCATGGTRTPLPDPAATARALRAAGPEASQRVTFGWSYADPRGPTEGEGVLRFNPPDSLRLDLFGPGDAGMAVALTPSGLSSSGRIEDVRLPPAPFLYATAGLFRPGVERPSAGFRTGEETVLVVPGTEGGDLRFHVRDGRIRRLEERRGRQVVRELALTWERPGPWPSRADYRDREEESRVRWTLEEAEAVGERFPSRIYELP